MESDELSGIHILISSLLLRNLELYGTFAWSPESLQGGLWIHSKFLHVWGGERLFHPMFKPGCKSLMILCSSEKRKFPELCLHFYISNVEEKYSKGIAKISML